MLPAKVAAVSYLNTLPLIEGLDRVEGLELIRAVPSRIADMVQDGSADLGLASVVDLARAPKPVVAVPAGAIGCRGRTLTVRLFSAVPPEQITAVHADTDSHTSVILTQVVLHDQFGIRPEIHGFDAREHPADAAGWPETVLLIGDKVVVGSPPAVRYPHQLDLGEAWHQLTGLPFVYAVWTGLAERATDPALHTAAALLDRQRRRNSVRLDRIVAEAAADRSWPLDLAREYLGTLMRYEVGAPEREAVELFLHKAADLGLLPSTKVTWLDPQPASTG